MKWAVYYQRDREIQCIFCHTEVEANTKALNLIDRFNAMVRGEQAYQVGGFDVTILKVVAAVGRTLNEYYLDRRPFKEV
jgi:hypothetical protein